MATRISSSRWIALASFALAVAGGRPARCEAPVLPVPTFDNSIQAGYYCINGCWESEATWALTVQRLKDRVGSGPYARLGLVYSVAPDMPWTADLAHPVLTSPTLESLREQLDRARANGIHLSFSLTAGISRSNGLYDAAAAEDRRNFQWYRDGLVLRETPSRYARKLRRHLETKMRAFAPLLMTVIEEYPDTFGICAGDGELELLADRLDESTPYEDQIIADYSPFVILEFRDWIRNTGMYGPGGAYEGQGRAASGTLYSDPVTGLASFNTDFGTAFSTWDLEYFNWSLDDPIDGDPKAIPHSVSGAPGWSPLPSSGPDFIAGGFDAPRVWNEYSPEFWQLWLTFRELLVGNYVRDFITWVMTTENASGAKVPKDRFYTYQIPADYYLETYPGCPQPNRRYLTSASPTWTADVSDLAGVGVTVFDGYQWPGGYTRTSTRLLPAMSVFRDQHWGMIEFNLSWPFIGGVETDPEVPAEQIRQGYLAGSRLFFYFPWLLDPEDEVTVNLDALGLFVSQARFQPRDAPWTSYRPPAVTGLAVVDGPAVEVAWSPRVFPERGDFEWTDWPGFLRHEVWQGTSADFVPGVGGTLVGTTRSPSLVTSGLARGSSYIKVAARSVAGLLGDAAVAALCLAPSITQFTTSAVLRTPGASSTLSWQTAGATSVTINGVARAASGTLVVRPTSTTTYLLQATNACGTVSRQVIVNVFNGTGGLGTPTVTAPTAGQVIGVSGVTLSWSRIAAAGLYDLRLFDNLSGKALFTGSLAGSASTSSLVDLADGAYRFAVRACTGGTADTQCGAFASVAFTVDLIQPTAAPVLTAPADGAALTTSTVAFSWTSVAKADASLPLYYELLVENVAAGGTAVQIRVPDPTLGSIHSLQSSAHYRTRVRACHGGCGPFSEPVDFAITLGPVPTTAPSITSAIVSGGNQLTVDWTAVAGADIYQIQVVQPSPAGPGGGALTVAARQVSETTASFSVPAGLAYIFVRACNGDGCGPYASVQSIDAPGPSPSVATLGTPMAQSTVDGPVVVFTWNRVAGDDGSNTLYRLYVQDLSRQSAALDLVTTQNYWAANLRAEGAVYAALVVASPGPSQVVGPASTFAVRGSSAATPTMVEPTHQTQVSAGNVLFRWSPVEGASLYEYYVAVCGVGSATARGVTPGLFVNVPLTASGAPTTYCAVARACPAGASCAPGSDAGWGPWNDALTCTATP